MVSMTALSVTFHVAEPGRGVVDAGTVTGLARFADGKWKDVSREWGYPDAKSRALWFEPEGALWTETEKRVLYLPAGGSCFVDLEMPLGGRPVQRRLRGTGGWYDLDRRSRPIGAYD
jgi:hypothetical protein